MNDFLNILLLSIQQATGREAAYYLPTKQVVVFNENGMLSPIDIEDNKIKINNTEFIIDYKPTDIITLNNIQKQPENSIKTGFEQIKNTQKTEQKQPEITEEIEEEQTEITIKTNEKLTTNISFSKINQLLKTLRKDNYLTQNIRLSEIDYKKIRLKDRINLIPVNESLDDETRRILHKFSQYITALFFAALNTTNNSERIEYLHELYNEVINDFDRVDIRKIEYRITQLSKIVNKQSAAHYSRKIGEKNRKEQMQRRARRMQILAFFLTLTIFTVVISIAVKKPSLPHLTTSLKKTEMIQLNDSLIYHSISVFEQKNDTTLTKWRRDKIVETLSGKEMTLDNYVDTLVFLIRKGWQKNGN